MEKHEVRETHKRKRGRTIRERYPIVKPILLGEEIQAIDPWARFKAPPFGLLGWSEDDFPS